MKKLLLLVGTLTTLTVPAFAADMATKTPVSMAPAFVSDPWTGWYAGLNIGYSWGRSSTASTFSDTTTGALLGSASGTDDLDGVIGGGQIGYNRQIRNWLLGIEADIQTSGQRGSLNTVCVGCGPIAGTNQTNLVDQRLDWFGTVRGRLGVTVTPTILVYATGGLAYAEVKSNGTFTGIGIPGPLTTTYSNSSTKTGWTAGGGIEGVISGRWTAKIEYLFVNLGTVSGGPSPNLVLGRDSFAANFSSNVTDNILRVGLNYRFQ